jgi:hypothetical protein
VAFVTATVGRWVEILRKPGPPIGILRETASVPKARRCEPSARQVALQ